MTTPETLPWWRAGETVLDATVARVTDDELDAPSLLDGWSRRTLAAHLAGNAEALVNLMTWATTGVETPMYASPEARRRGIEEIAALADGALRSRVEDATARLAEAIGSAPDAAWDTGIRTALGREVPAAQVPWMRCREVWVHAVDLDAGTGFSDVPDDVLAALVDDVVRTWTQRDDLPDLTFHAGGRVWGTGSVDVHADLADLAAAVTGRSSALDTHGVVVPRWL